MPRIAGLSRSATVAWGASAEHASLLATGTVAGAISDSFDTTAHLEVFSIDLSSQNSDMSALGSLETSERFHRLAWGTRGIEDGSLPYGILAGGMVDGSIKIYNPALMIAGEGAEPLVASIEKHTGAVRGLEFNPAVPNLLASGAGDSEVYITDLTNPSNPRLFSPGTNNASSTSDIACVAWNRKVTHILASTAHNGMSVVWDLKLKRPVINFADSSSRGQRNSVIEWNPDVATQVLVASEDDLSPKLQIWDLRNALAPVRELIGHQRGILTASWCPNDANLLLSSGKDHRTLCWDPASGEVVCELPAAGNWTFDVKWSPRIPAIISSCSFDGEVSIYSLQDYPSPDRNGLDCQQALSRPMKAPKWLRRPCGATFGFGGKLVLFNAAAGSKISLMDVVTDHAIVSRAHELNSALETRNLNDFCERKLSMASTARDAEEWRLMQVLCSQEQRQHLLTFLGVAEPAAAPPPPVASQVPNADPLPAVTDDDPAAIFSALAVETEKQEQQDALLSESSENTAIAQTGAEDSASPLAALTPAPHDPMLSRAVLNGNFESAVAMCMRAGRVADALVLAASGGPDLWVATRDQYLQSNTTPFMQILSAIVHQNFGSYVANSELSAWKETLGLVNTYASAEELPALCNQLASRLEVETGDAASATLCYMCAANTHKAVELWQAHYAAAVSSGSGDATGPLLDLMEKIVVFQEAAGTREGYQMVSDKLAEFASLLASQGCLPAAMGYLLQLPVTDPTGPASTLMHRIHGCTEGLLAEPPVYPFEYVDVGVAPVLYDQSQTQYQHDPQYQNDSYQTDGYPAASQPYDPNWGYAQPQYDSYNQPQYDSYNQPHYEYEYSNHQPEQHVVPAPIPAPLSIPAPVPAPVPAPMPTPLPAPAPAPPYQYTPQPAYNPTGAAPRQNAYPSYVPTPTPQPAYNPTPTPTPPPVHVPPPAPAPPPPPAPSYDPQPVIAIVQGLIAKCNAYNLVDPIDKRKLDDVVKRAALLQKKLTTGEVSAGVFERLLPLCQALAAGDSRTALDLHVAITTTDWADNGPWLMGLKRLIELTAKLNVTL